MSCLRSQEHTRESPHGSGFHPQSHAPSRRFLRQPRFCNYRGTLLLHFEELLHQDQHCPLSRMTHPLQDRCWTVSCCSFLLLPSSFFGIEAHPHQRTKTLPFQTSIFRPVQSSWK